MRYKRAKKAKVKIYTSYEVKVYSVQCPHCRAVFVGGIEKNVLMFSCNGCGNTIDLRDENGKRAYEESEPIPEIKYCECSETEFIKREACVKCGKLKSNSFVR